MQFPTFEFAVFFLLVYAGAWSLRASNEWRKIALLLASWFFYGTWDTRFVALLFASAVGNWAVGLAIARSSEEAGRRWVMLGVGVNLLILAYFKYAGFFLDQLRTLLEPVGMGRDLPFLEAIAAVGVSFFTFQAISYLVDVHRRRMPPADLLDLSLLMSFFPHLFAGPIVRASDLLPQFRRTPTLDRGTATAALALIGWGLFKKAVIASELAAGLVDPAFHDPARRSSLDLLLGAYGYAVQIYCDFSAYSDMAIGLAALLGYTFPRNFDQPYRASSLRDFWRRWHISLSSWLRDYLYIPLGGSRRGERRTYLNLFVTMSLGGLWHGASWNFLVWGSLHGTWLSIERAAGRAHPDGWRMPRWLGVLITFHVVVLGWIFFRAQDFTQALGYLRGIAAGDWRNTLASPALVLLIALGLVIHAVPARGVREIAVRVRGWSAPLAGAALACAILIVDAMRPAGVAPFIYYQF